MRGWIDYMREIKFRSWVETPTGLSFMNYRIEFTGGAINDIFATSGKEPINPCASKITYMQYTGLKDCNGVEIYEGDIVRCYTKELAVVTERHSSFGLKTNSYGFKPFFDIFGEIEIIGNVYENQELL